jgi:DNA-directed RNA polymerase specialized sigma24 family protein
MDVTGAPGMRLAKPMVLDGDSDPDARVAAIYVAHFQQLAGLATMLAGSRAVGEEIAQEAFVIALQQERRKRGYLTDPVWPWLRITAVRLAGRHRKRLLREALTYRLHGPIGDTSNVWDVETVDIVLALRRLPSRMRLCVILSHVEDQSTASIAAMLRCSTQNVDAQLRKGRERLRTLLGERYNLNED